MRFLKTLLLLALMGTAVSADMFAYDSPTEGVLNSTFVDEATMKQDLLQMLANFALYMKNDFNSVDDTYGYFKGESSGQSNEAGVRTNADLSMICAFLLKYAKPAGVSLPSEVTWSDVETMAKKSLAWAYGTHKANKLRQTTNSAYWGSTSADDFVWESSLWAMSVAYSAFFQWNSLSDTQKGYIYALLKAECNYELTRSIPTGYSGDTKAEENGWEADILAATLGLYPDDTLAQQWFNRLRQFAVNSYSHASDLQKNTPLDAWYDGKSASDLFLGKNIYDDYTLQNHNMFHTSYQNVVMQELGEAALALKMFQLGTKGTEQWKTNALMNNSQEVMDEVLDWLATADGELAMPNGNDWSLFLFDQITSYSTQACFQRDPNALMLENLAYKNIKARQTTTSDGSWLLRPDVSARRMGVEAHRVMMTYLMHEYMSTADLTPTDWTTFRQTYKATKYFPAQNIVRNMSKDRFTCFSWNTSLPDYSGVIVPNSVDKAKIMVPFRTHHTGNLLGVYSRADYSVSLPGQYALYPDAFAMNGIVTFSNIPQAFCLYATSGNAVILVDALKANSATTVSSEQGGMMGISVDEFTNTQRTIYYNGGSVTTDGTSYATWTSPWSNIDDYLGFVVTKHGETVTGAFGDKSSNNSIMTAKIYPSYNGSSSTVGTSMNHIRGFVYYTDVTANQTAQLSAAVQDLTTLSTWPEGWHGVLVPDPDGTYYLLLTNLFASDTTPWEDLTVTCPQGAPVFTQVTTLAGSDATATFYCAKNYNIANELKLFVSGATNLKAVQADENSRAAYLQNEQGSDQNVTVYIIDENGTTQSGSVTVPANGCVLVSLSGGSVTTTNADFPGNYRNVAYGSSVDANSYDGHHLPLSVIDAQDNTYYQTLNSASSGSEYLTFNLRNQYTIDRIVITPQNGQAAPSSYIAQYGDEADSWTDITGLSTTVDGEGRTVLTFTAIDARFVRLQLLGSSRVAINKVGIYGAAPSEITEVVDPNDYTGYITNPSFENDGAAINGAPTGWTLGGTSQDTGTRSTSNGTYAMTNSNGNYLFNTWWTGYPITQTTAVLPAGTYTLSCVVSSNYGTSEKSYIYLIVDDEHPAYADCTDSSVGYPLSYTFTLDTDKAVKIGVVGSASDGSYTANGYNWYKVDNFKLTRVTDENLAEQYFDNPSFEKDDISGLTADATRGAYTITVPSNWTLTGDTPDVHDIMTDKATATDNNFGAPGEPTNGSQMFYMRVGWSSKTSTLSTTSSTPLPAGNYSISFDYRTGYANSANSSFVFSCAGVSNSAVTFNQGSLSDWKTATIDFTLATAQTITPTIAITWKSGGSSFLMDNLQLETIDDDSETRLQQIKANGGDATFLLQDPKCESAAGTSWTSSTGAITLRQHWSGEGYQNTYQERTATGTVSQTLTNMPAGTYKLVAALRANTGCTITPRLNSTDGATFTGTGNASTDVAQINKNGIQMPYHADRGFTTNNTGRGWQWGSATATLATAGNLVIAFDMTGSSWMSIDDVHLYLMSDANGTYCESINADANTFEVSTTGKTVTADIVLANNNTLILSPTQVYTDLGTAADNNLVGGTSMESFVLYDKQPVQFEADQWTATTASYIRNVTSKWGTVILPYPMASSSNIQFLKLTGASDTALDFTNVDNVDANTPVAFQRLQTDPNVDFTAHNVTVTTTSATQGSLTTASGWSEEGYYTKTSLTSGDDIYYIAQDKFWHYNGGQALNLNPFRTIMHGPADANIKSLNIVIGEDEEATSLESLSLESAQPTQLYDLTGRMVQNSHLSRGIYIANGKKVILK